MVQLHILTICLMFLRSTARVGSIRSGTLSNFPFLVFYIFIFFYKQLQRKLKPFTKLRNLTEPIASTHSPACSSSSSSSPVIAGTRLHFGRHSFDLSDARGLYPLAPELLGSVVRLCGLFQQ